MATDDLVQLEIMLNRFNRLINEVMRGDTQRNSFLPWELEILLDMETCEFERRRRLEILRQYQRAVAKQLEKGPGPPMKLSEFLKIRAERAAMLRSRRPQASPAPGDPRSGMPRSKPGGEPRCIDNAPASGCAPIVSQRYPYPTPVRRFAK